ncbi:activating signal cointegrator 1 complex subunit 1-like [Drosophila grimshawi]|uniref:activating signal cointegrator 1 complex subunit 1-like n=1 Tax=Drosophila grimshawi TaxID=7222 RepID=UPI001C9330B1|nr:activating signal cointegrator 1 complex subunit 1-like [Drosophila grimshawi]
MSDCKRSYRYRAFDYFVRAIGFASLFIVMSAIYRQDYDPGSNYIHPKHGMQKNKAKDVNNVSILTKTVVKLSVALNWRREISTDLVIQSKERSNVCAALRKIRLLIESLRKRMRPTHFLAVALNSGGVQQRFLKLKQNNLHAQLPGIDQELFISENCIHITLGVYVLLDDAERKQAISELELCRQWLVDLHTPFELNIQGLEIFNDDPSSTRVLYARIESPELQQFANKCKKHFQTTGLYAADNNDPDSIKLHMTLLNSRYTNKKPNKNESNSFDAREILKRFGDYDFGKAQCNEVHMCVCKSYCEGDDFYKTTGSLKF